MNLWLGSSNYVDACREHFKTTGTVEIIPTEKVWILIQSQSCLLWYVSTTIILKNSYFDLYSYFSIRLMDLAKIVDHINTKHRYTTILVVIVQIRDVDPELYGHFCSGHVILWSNLSFFLLCKDCSFLLARYCDLNFRINIHIIFFYHAYTIYIAICQAWLYLRLFIWGNGD